jgi:hypothetical protein
VNGSHIYFSGDATAQEIVAEFAALVNLLEFLEGAARVYSREKGTRLAQIDHLKAMAREREIREQQNAT